MLNDRVISLVKMSIYNTMNYSCVSPMILELGLIENRLHEMTNKQI